MTRTLPTPTDEAGAPGTTTRRGRTRERLLDAAYDVFAEQGVAAASVEAICERAGFTRGAFYSNFGTKEELFFALMDREKNVRLAALERQVDALLPRLERAATPLDEDALGRLLLEFLSGPYDDERWCLVSSELELLALRDRDVSARFLADHDRFLGELEGTVERALAAAGRAFVVDTVLGVRLLVQVHDENTRRAMLAGDTDSPGGDERGQGGRDRTRRDLARLLLAITRPLDA